MSRIRLAMVCALAFAAIYPQREAVADIVGVVYNPATGHYYKLSTSNANWQTAKTDSEALGGYLVCINSAAENSWLVTNGLAANTPWIGATDEASEGTWVWVSGETWSYTSWGGGEPNNAGNEDHVTIGSTGFWNDWNGGNGARYITEWNSDPNGPPEDPANLVATVLSDQRIDLRWDDLSSRETQFQVERASPAGGAFAQIAQLPTDTRTYSDTGVVGETQYSYRVRATGSAGPSGYTNTATVTTHPPTVTGLVATTVSNTKVQLTWVDQANSETGVEIERGLDSPGQGFGLIATQPADSVGYLDTTASPETLYSYRVRVVGAGGKSVYCPEASATTGPADPLAVTLLAPTDRLVTVTWYDASSLETGFEVQRAPGTPGTAFTTIGTSSANTPTYNDDTAQPETYYTYRVRTVGAQASSDWSAQAFITTPPFAPSNAVVEALSPTRIRLTWTDNTTREISQEVMRKGETDAFFQLLEVVGRNVTEYEDVTATQEARYVYRVAAVGVDGRSGWGVATEMAMPAMLVVRKASITRPKAKGAGKRAAVARLAVSGEFDVGASDVDLTNTTTLGIGAGSIDIGAFAPKGRNFSYQAPGVRAQLKPFGSSRVAFSLLLEGDIVSAIEPDGDLTLSYTNGSFRAIGTVTLVGDAFLPGKAGNYVDPPLNLLSLSASLKFGAKDNLTIKGSFHAPGGVPDAAQDLILRLGTYEFLARGDQFERSGDRWSYSQSLVGSRKVTLDYAKGLITISLRGVELNNFMQGAVPVPVYIEFGDVRLGDTPLMASNGKTLKF